MATAKTPTKAEARKYEEISESLGGLDDVTLVFEMLGLLASPDWDPAPMFGCITPLGAIVTRKTFTEIAARWIPPEVYGAAFREIWPEDEDEEVS